MIRRPRVRDAAVAVAFAVAFAALFSPVLFGGRYLTDGGDGVRFALAAYLREPSLWEPDVMLGYPWSSNLDGFWDPLAAALRTIPGTFNLYMFLAYPIAAFGTYRLVYQTTRSVAGGCIAGLSFAMGGFMIGHLGHYDLVHPAAWTPWVLWSLTALRERVRANRVAAVAVCVFLTALAGGPQVLAYTLVTAVVLVGALGVRGGEAPRSALAACAGLVLGLGLAAIALVPGAYLAAHSVRAHVAFDRFISDSVPLDELPVRLFFPYARRDGWVELGDYAGIVPLVLAIVAVCTGVREPFVRAWTMILIGALALSSGDALKLASITYHLPILGLFRAQGRYALDVTLAVAVLAGFGASAIERGAIPARAVVRAIVVAGAIGAIAFATAAASVPPGLRRTAALGVPLAFFAAGTIAIARWALRPSSRLARAIVVALACADLAMFASGGPWHDTVVTGADLVPPTPVAALARDARDHHERLRFIADGTPFGFDPGRALAWNIPVAGGAVQLEVARTAALLHLDDDGADAPDVANDASARGAALAAVRYLIVPPNAAGPGPLSAPRQPAELGVRIGAPRWVRTSWVGRDTSTASFVEPIPASRIALETSLSDAVTIANRAHVADVIVRDAAGATIVLPLRAGRDTAERGYDRPAVRAAVRHARAAIARTDGADHTYRTTLILPRPTRIASLAIAWRGSDPARGYLTIDRVELDDDATKTAYPLTARTTLERDPADWRRVDVAAPFLVFENRHPYGRAWLVHTVIPARDGATLDPARAAVVAGVPPLHTRTGAHDAVTIDDLTATAMTLTATCARRCFVVTSDAYDAGWSATIDGRTTTVYPADDALRGVFVPPGRHELRFAYRPAGLSAGIAISAACALALAALTLAGARRRSFAALRVTSPA